MDAHPEGDVRTEPFAWPNGARAAVSFTFDDARSSQVLVGLPILDRAGVSATFYVDTTRMMEHIDAWEAAAAHGHEIGNHTSTHPCSHGLFAGQRVWLEAFDLTRMEADVLAANAVIATHFGRVPVSFAYPCGQTYVGDARHSYKPIIARHFMTGRGFPNRTHNDPGSARLEYLRSVQVDCMSYEECVRLVDAAAAEGGWLIFTGHEVGDGSVYQTVDAPGLERLIEYIAERGDVLVTTVEQAVTHVIGARPSDPEDIAGR